MQMQQVAPEKGKAHWGFKTIHCLDCSRNWEMKKLVLGKKYKTHCRCGSYRVIYADYRPYGREYQEHLAAIGVTNGSAPRTKPAPEETSAPVPLRESQDTDVVLALLRERESASVQEIALIQRDLKNLREVIALLQTPNKVAAR